MISLEFVLDLLGLLGAVVMKVFIRLSRASLPDVGNVARVTFDVINYLLDATVGKLHVIGSV